MIRLRTCLSVGVGLTRTCQLRRLSSLPQDNFVYEPDPVFVERFPGSRIIQLSKSDNKKHICLQTCGMIQDLLKSYERNIVVGAIFISSNSVDLFSEGVNKDDITAQPALYEQIRSLITIIRTHSKPILSVFDGKVAGSAFGIFSSSKYVLGTETSELVINELLEGYLPIGGLPYKFWKGCSIGVAAARYYGFSGSPAYGNDLFCLGLVTQLTISQPYFRLADALANTIPPRDRTSNDQTPVIDITVLPTLLDTMNADIDPEYNSMFEDEVWEKGMLVNPNTIELEYEDNVEDIEKIEAEVQHCFGSDDVNDILARLELQANKPTNTMKWAQKSLDSMRTVDPLVLKLWLRLTRLAETSSLDQILTYETAANNFLFNRPKYTKIAACNNELLNALNEVNDQDVDKILQL